MGERTGKTSGSVTALLVTQFHRYYLTAYVGELTSSVEIEMEEADQYSAANSHQLDWSRSYLA